MCWPRKGTPAHAAEEWEGEAAQARITIERHRRSGITIRRLEKVERKAYIKVKFAQMQLTKPLEAYKHKDSYVRRTREQLRNPKAEACRLLVWELDGIRDRLASARNDYARKGEAIQSAKTILRAAEDNARHFRALAAVTAHQPRSTAKARREKKPAVVQVAPGVTIGRRRYEAYKRACGKRARIQEGPHPKGWQVRHACGHAIFKSIEVAIAA